MKIEIEKMKNGWSITCSDGRWAEIVRDNNPGMAAIMFYDGEYTEGYMMHNEDTMPDVLAKFGLYDD